ncbi:MAG: heme exporter protein CcmD, partial [Betaproteobacteria bacterium]|nr:heme exporter protein CcmD [Betaproteobacteria bacterium]
MKDHSFYILMSYGAFALVLLIELYALRMQRTRAVKEAKRMDESMDSTRDAEVNRASDAADHEATLRSEGAAADRSHGAG